MTINSGLFGRLCAFFIAFVLSLVGTVANAATYYVSSSGSDSNNGTSTATPWADLSVSVGKLNAGDTLLLKRGDTFNETSAVFLSDNNVTIGAYGEGAKPIWDGQSHTYPNNSAYASQLSVSSNNVTVTGIEFKNSQGMGVTVTGDNVTIDGIYVNSPYFSGITCHNTADLCTVKNSEVYQHNYQFGPFATTSLTGWGVGISYKGTNGRIANNYVHHGWGEGINANTGADHGTIEHNISFANRIGVYVDAGRYITIRNNLILGTSDANYQYAGGTRPGAGIVLNTEDRAYSQSDDTLGDKFLTDHVQIYNNLVGNSKTGFEAWFECTPSNTQCPVQQVYTDVQVFNNTFVGNNWQLSFNSGSTAASDLIIRNNIFITTDSLNNNGSNTPASGALILSNNYWATTPSAWAVGTSDVVGSLTLNKMTDWRAVDDITDIDASWSWATKNTAVVVGAFEPSNFASTVVKDAGTASIGGGQTYSSDYHGNTVVNPPNIGSFEATSGSGGGPSGVTISAVNGGVNMLTASAINTAAGTGLRGAYGGLAKDSDSNQALSGVIGTPDGATLYFTAGDLSGITSAPYSLDIYYDTPALYPTSPRTWTPDFTGAVVISNAATNWAFDSGARIAANSGAGTGNVAKSATFAVTSGQTVNAECYYGAGTSGDMRMVVYNAGGTQVRFGGLGVGNHNGQTAANNSGGTSIQTFSETLVNTGLYKGAMQFVANYTGNHYLQFGPDTATLGNDVILYECRAWVDRTQNTLNYVLATPFSATLSDLNTDNIIDPISAANGSNLFALSGDIGGVSIPFLTPNVSGSVATFKSPDLSGLANGNQTLTLNVAQPAEINQTPTGWPTNTATALVTSYTGTHLGYGGGAKLTVDTGGADWGGFKIDDLVTVAAGDVIEQWVDVVQSTGGQVRVSLTNQTAGGYIDYKGIFGALSSTAQTACSSSTLSETAQDGMTRIKILCTSAAAGAYRLSITTNSSVVGDAVVVLGRTTFVNAAPIAKTLTVTNPGGIVPEPELVKKIAFRFAEGNDTSLACRSAQAGQASQYNSADEGSGDIFIVIGSGNPRPSPGGQFPTILAYDTNATIVNGEYDLDESDLEYGSINALDTGDQGYYFWAGNASGSCRWSAPVQVIAE